MRPLPHSNKSFPNATTYYGLRFVHLLPCLVHPLNIDFDRSSRCPSAQPTYLHSSNVQTAMSIHGCLDLNLPCRSGQGVILSAGVHLRWGLDALGAVRYDCTVDRCTHFWAGHRAGSLDRYMLEGGAWKRKAKAEINRFTPTRSFRRTFFT
jgi:hypothetical protein